jgi:hypothetical protein
MQKAPPPIQTLVPEVPEPFADVIARCLEPDPDKRFQTSEDVSAALALLDDNGVPIPIPPRFSKKLIASAAVAVIALVTGTWYFTRTPPPPKQHDPVGVVIADFQNNTNDPTFDRTLEQTLRRALEGAGFISAYDRSRIRSTFSVTPPAKWDELAARELAVKQGVGVVLSGSIENRGTGYTISVKATQTGTGKAIVNVRSCIEQRPGPGRGDHAGNQCPQRTRRRDLGLQSAARYEGSVDYVVGSGQPLRVCRRRAIQRQVGGGSAQLSQGGANRSAVRPRLSRRGGSVEEYGPSGGFGEVRR